MSDAIPFVAKSPEMKLDWLVGAIKKNVLTCFEISPYVSLLLSEYQEVLLYSIEEAEGTKNFSSLFDTIERHVLKKMIECTDLYDIPVLLELVSDLDAEDVGIILKKVPPPYEKKPQVVLDKLFQVVYDKTSEKLLEKAAESIMKSGDVPLHFVESYQRFKEIREDEKVLSSLFPQASGTIRVE